MFDKLKNITSFGKNENEDEGVKTPSTTQAQSTLSAEEQALLIAQQQALQAQQPTTTYNNNNTMMDNQGNIMINLAELNNVLCNYHTTKYVIYDNNGGVDYDYPKGSIQGLDLVSHNVMVDLVGQLIEIQSTIIDQIVNQMQSNHLNAKADLNKKVNDIEKELHELREVNDELREVNAGFVNDYGHYIDPEILLHELFNGGRKNTVNKGMIMIVKSKWKYRYLASSKYQKSVNFWMNIFRGLDIFLDFGAGKRKAKMSLGEAQRELHFYRKTNDKNVDNEV